MTMTEDQREFLRTHRLCVYGFQREQGPPSLSPVYYLLDGDELLISTTRSRAKARAARRDPEVTLCVLHEEFPFPYLTLFGRAAVEEDETAVVDVLMRLREVMTGVPTPPEQRGEVAERARADGRVVLRVTPQRFVSTPPRGARPAPPPPSG